MIKTYINPAIKQWQLLLERPLFDTTELEGRVKKIMDTVKENGDAALKQFSKQFDKIELENLQISEQEFADAQKNTPPEIKTAIKIAVKNITTFHEAQAEEVKKIQTMPGVTCWRKSVAIDKVGIYIPGGTAPLFSTVLMLAIPAKIAGCKEIILCTPPGKNGIIHPAILYAAQQTGITKAFKIGGGQAIAAMTYGTESVPKVYKLFGPGNQYVTMAKMIASMQGVAIDMPAGPSEVMVVADDSANPEFIAADLLSQAEHGLDSQAILLTNSKNIIEATIEQLKIQTAKLSRKEFILKSLENSKAVLIEDEQALVDFMNAYAPEHLILSVKNYTDFAEKVRNAGSVFLGNYTPESAGDYASGTNHTLPTNGFAKAFSGVSLDSYVKKITFQELTKNGLKQIGKTIEIMAANEQLDAHKNAVTLRLKKLNV